MNETATKLANHLLELAKDTKTNAKRVYEELRPLLEDSAKRGLTSFSVGIRCSEDVGTEVVSMLMNDNFNMSYDEANGKLVISWAEPFVENKLNENTTT